MLGTETCFTKFGVYLHFGGACNGASFTVRPYRGQQCSTASGDAAVKVVWELYLLTQWQLAIEYQATSEHCYSSTALTVFSLVLTDVTFEELW